MVDALASDRSDQPFGEAVLPRRAWGDGLVANAHGAQSVRDGSAIDAIPITDHVARRLSPRECFGDLACDPVRGRMGCDVYPDKVSAGQPNDDKGIEQVEANARNNEQVHGGDVRRVVTQEGAPALGRRSTSLDHVLRDAGLSDLEAELEQLAMDARRSPQRIVNAHPPDQCAQSHVDLRSTSKGTGFPPAVPTEAGPMPTHQGLRSDDSDGPEHRWKPSIQQDQEHAIPICVPANESMPQDSLTHTQQLGIPDSTPPESALIAPVFMIDPYWRSAQRATAKLRQNLLGGDFRLVRVRLAQHIAAAPYCFNVVLAIRRAGEFLAQLAHEDVDNLDLRLVHAAAKVVEEHFLGQRCAFAQAQELQHLVLLAGEMHARAVHFHRLGVEVDHEIAGLDDRLGVAPGAAHDGVDTRHQLVLVKWLGHVGGGAESETSDFVLDPGEAGEDENGRLHLGDAQRAQHLESRHVGKVQVEQDNVVIVELAKIAPLFAQVGGVDVEALRL